MLQLAQAQRGYLRPSSGWLELGQATSGKAQPSMGHAYAGSGQATTSLGWYRLLPEELRLASVTLGLAGAGIGYLRQSPSGEA
jgi:hypothetical protein